MQKILITTIFILFLLALPACTKVSVTVVQRTQEEMLKLKITQPANGEILQSDSARITFEPTNFMIGQQANIHVVMDNGPVLVHKSAEPFYISSLAEGRHIVRAFPARKIGESIKKLQRMYTLWSLIFRLVQKLPRTAKRLHRLFCTIECGFTASR